MVANNLLDRLKKKQAEEGLSDHKFAKKLNFSYHQLWQMTRTGDREIGLTVLKGCRVYPELALDVLLFLGFDVVKVTKLLANATARHETHQERLQGGLRGLIRGIYLRFLKNFIYR